MYRCNNCGAEFERPDTYCESRPIGTERFSCCPMCQNLGFKESGEDEYYE